MHTSKPMTPERMLSESEEDQKGPLMPGFNMPRIMDKNFKPSDRSAAKDQLSQLAKGLESNSILKDAFDLEELKRKQEDLLRIQEMVQKNIEGIQQQIEK